MHVGAVRIVCLQRPQRTSTTSLNHEGTVDVLLQSKLAVMTLLTLSPATYHRYPRFCPPLRLFLEHLDQPSSYNQALTQTLCIDRAPCAKLVLSQGREALAKWLDLASPLIAALGNRIHRQCSRTTGFLLMSFSVAASGSSLIEYL